ncbi:MAG: glycoside hydrolase family 29 (alpha-L-fucosidase) [Phycisphaerales bacterium]|nr:glycoside hydrolase family 29 (alpha-L-fucosidase) [Phycisphaerales bacterium]
MFTLLVAGIMSGSESQAMPAPPPPSPVEPLPTARQLAWQDLEFTGFIHFGPNTFTDKEWGHGDEPATVFNPTALDARQWVRVMRAAGMKGVVITAKHHDGFCNWPTAKSSHSVASSPWQGGKGDVLRELSDACREAGLKFGVYLSPWDRNNPEYGSGEPYNEYFRDQLREVLTNYGEIFEVWFDGACGEGPNGKRQVYDFPSFRALVRSLQPSAVMFSDVGPDIRWVGNESGWAGETCWAMLKAKGHGIGSDNPPSAKSLNEGDIDGESWIPAECDVSIRPGWFYHASEDGKVKSPAQLFDLWERSVGHNANLHLNFPVDRRGLIHENDAAAVLGLRAIIDATYGDGTDITRERATVVSNDRTATIEIALDPTKAFDRVVLAEPIAFGQRIARFRVSACATVGGAPSDWTTLAEATTVGHKRIVRVPETTAARLRIEVFDSRGSVLLSHIAAHHTRFPQ